MSRVNTQELINYLEHAVDHLLEGLDALLLAAVDQVVQVCVLGQKSHPHGIASPVRQICHSHQSAIKVYKLCCLQPIYTTAYNLHFNHELVY